MKRSNLACRHSRESGNPSLLLHQGNMDSRFRGNDDQESWGFVKKLSPLPEKKMKPKHLQRFPHDKIFPGQQWTFTGLRIGSVGFIGRNVGYTPLNS